MSLEKIKNNFFLRFLISSLILLVIWKPVSVLYLHFISSVSGLFFRVFDHAVSLVIADGVLKMMYPSVGGTPLQFSMGEADQIFLNIIVFVSLVLSSYRVVLKKRIVYGIAALGILGLIHVFVIYMYTDVTIWDFIAGQPDQAKSMMTLQANAYFSGRNTELFRYLLFNWNSWGWDVIPLLLWLPVGLRQFSYLIPAHHKK
ncbi:hypothetical protein ACFL6I_14190 [candidate division KSB1 bacterium]